LSKEFPGGQAPSVYVVKSPLVRIKRPPSLTAEGGVSREWALVEGSESQNIPRISAQMASSIETPSTPVRNTNMLLELRTNTRSPSPHSSNSSSPRMRATIGDTFVPSTPVASASEALYNALAESTNSANSSPFIMNDDASKELYERAIRYLQRSQPAVQDNVLPDWALYTFSIPHVSSPIEILTDGRSVKFNHSRHAPVNRVRTQYPIPPYNDQHDEMTTYYFQVRVMKLQSSADMAIGLIALPYPSDTLPGHARSSIAYNSDGSKYLSSVDGYSYAVPYDEGDVIGCGYVVKHGLVFFTRNERGLGAAAIGWGLGKQVYPAIGVEGTAEISVEFTHSNNVL